MDMPKILVVDDEEDLCEILKFNLEIEGYEVDTAFSAEEALKMDIASYQLLLLDVMMGEISGFKMASILKKEEKTADIPIIFLTAKDTENDMHDLAADGNGRNARRSFKLADDNKVCHPVKGLQEIGNDKGNGKRNKALPNTPRKGIDSHKTRS